MPTKSKQSYATRVDISGWSCKASAANRIVASGGREALTFPRFAATTNRSC